MSSESNKRSRWAICFFVVAAVAGAATWLGAQVRDRSVSVPNQLPAVDLNFGSPELTSLGKQGTVMLRNMEHSVEGLCSSSTVWMEA